MVDVTHHYAPTAGSVVQFPASAKSKSSAIGEVLFGGLTSRNVVFVWALGQPSGPEGLQANIDALAVIRSQVRNTERALQLVDGTDEPGAGEDLVAELASTAELRRRANLQLLD